MTAAVTPRHARAYVGAGMLVEFLAHLILRRAARRAALPIVLNGTVVGRGLVGRECTRSICHTAGIRWMFGTCASRSARIRNIDSGRISPAIEWRGTAHRWSPFHASTIR